MQNHIERLNELRQMAAHGCAHPPPNPVPLHRSAQDLAHGQADAGAAGTPALVIKSDYVAREVLPALLVNRLKISMLEQS